MDLRKVIALGLTLLLLVGGGWWVWQTQRRARATEYALEASYQRAFFDLMKIWKLKQPPGQEPGLRFQRAEDYVFDQCLARGGKCPVEPGQYAHRDG